MSFPLCNGAEVGLERFATYNRKSNALLIAPSRHHHQQHTHLSFKFYDLAINTTYFENKLQCSNILLTTEINKQQITNSQTVRHELTQRQHIRYVQLSHWQYRKMEKLKMTKIKIC